ncbi:hypothetical protein TNCV_4894701 [Trichonephila clavipes]|nr:hypothetical protein TNCV_4894701 [Trichonephila clavipes]
MVEDLDPLSHAVPIVTKRRCIIVLSFSRDSMTTARLRTETLRRSNCTVDLEPANSLRLDVELPCEPSFYIFYVYDFSLECQFVTLFYARDMRHSSERDSKSVDPFAN